MSPGNNVARLISQFRHLRPAQVAISIVRSVSLSYSQQYDTGYGVMFQVVKQPIHGGFWAQYCSWRIAVAQLEPSPSTAATLVRGAQ